MTVWATGYTLDPLQWVSHSTDSGFTSIDEVVSVMGPDYFKRSEGWVIYRNGNRATIFSRAKMSIDPNDNKRYRYKILNGHGGSESCSG